jgi:hypothetical protein
LVLKGTKFQELSVDQLTLGHKDLVPQRILAEMGLPLWLQSASVYAGGELAKHSHFPLGLRVSSLKSGGISSFNIGVT